VIVRRVADEGGPWADPPDDGLTGRYRERLQSDEIALALIAAIMGALAPPTSV
jgi:hypothetical protein